jgi:hypothetical protein
MLARHSRPMPSCLQLALLVLPLCTARAQAPPEPAGGASAGALNVRDFGAVGDGTTDDTAAFAAALDLCGRQRGGIVFAPTGNYLIKGHLSVPDNVALEGVFTSPTARSQMSGTTLLAVEGRGADTGEPFVFLHANSTLRGVTVFYPEQDVKVPVPYPWCVRGIGDNCSVLDVLLVNPWKGVDFGTYNCGRHLIRGLYGQPLNIGLFVDRCYDCGRLEDIHFWPFWSTDLIPYTQKAATAILICRADWEMLSNCFVLGYKVGFHFTSAGSDGPNCLITNSGPDACITGVLVDVAQVHAGLLFTNCQINAGIQVTAGTLGPVKFMNCGIFNTGYSQPYVQDGDARAYYAVHKGQGRMTFVGCHFYYPAGPFVPADLKPDDLPGIVSDGNGLTLSACDFTDFPFTHIWLGPAARSTLVVGNRLKGGLKLTNTGQGQVEAGLNIGE